MLGFSGYDIAAMLYETETTRVYRGVENSHERAVLLKTTASRRPDLTDLARLRREYDLQSGLTGGDACRLIHQDRLLAIESDDQGGRPLAEVMAAGPCPPDLFFRIASALVAAIEGLHREGVLLGELRPTGLLYNERSQRIQLTDFSQASSLAREHPRFNGTDGLGSTRLPYLSPEQTGLMNRVVDYRSDFYGLGIVLHQLVSRELPFRAGDALEWLHAHVARDPRRLIPQRAGFPPMLEKVIRKLMAKQADDRYQSAAGLSADLRLCEEQAAQGLFAGFDLGELDMSPDLHLPQRLYGREAEIAELDASFDRMMLTGQSETVLLAGYCGIGKSSLVAEFSRHVMTRRALIAMGTCERFQRNVPYCGLAEVFKSLVGLLLTESDERISRWRDRLRQAVGSNGQLLVDIVPQLELVIGPQPPVPELPPLQALNRSHSLLRAFLSVFARPEHPLVLFFDNVQWADPASLGLLDQLASSSAGNLLLIGAYRDNEVGRSHPLTALMAHAREADRALIVLPLTPLSFPDVLRLLADTVRTTPGRVEPLAELVYQKTRGNPFFCFQFLTALHQDGFLYFDVEKLIWRWDLEGIARRDFTDNVIEFMIGELQRLPEPTQNLVSLGSFLGFSFDADTLGTAAGRAVAEIDAELRPALDAGLVVRDPLTGYRFLHDRVQEAAYALTSAGDRQSTHLRIGRQLLARPSTDELDDQLFDVVNHLNRGAVMMTNAAEIARLLELNEAAGLKAQRAGVYAAATEYLSVAIDLLPSTAAEPDPDGRRRTRAFGLRLARANCEFLCGRFLSTARMVDKLLQVAHDPVERARVQLLNIQLQVAQGDNETTVAVARACLAELGITVPSHPTQQQVQESVRQIETHLGDRSIESLLELPELDDPTIVMVMKVLAAASTAAFFIDINLWAYCNLRMVLLSLDSGNGDESVTAYTHTGFQLGAFWNRNAEGARWLALAERLVQRRGAAQLRGRLAYFQSLSTVWTKPLRTSVATMEMAIPMLIEVGNLVTAALGHHVLVLTAMLRGDPLDVVSDLVGRSHAFAVDVHFPMTQRVAESNDRLIQRLRDLEPTLPAPPPGADAAVDGLPFVRVCGWLDELVWASVMGDHEAAERARAEAEPLLWAIPGLSPQLDFHLHGSLALASRYFQLTPDEQAVALDQLQASHQLVESWGLAYPPTFGHVNDLICAELARVTGRTVDALRHYDWAVANARANRFVHHEALAAERAAAFCRSLGLTSAADAHLRTAHDAYRTWGATAKVRALELAHPGLWGQHPERNGASVSTLSTRSSADALAVSKAAQAISGEIVQDSLLRTLLRITLEQAGAQYGVFLLSTSGRLAPVAVAHVVDQGIEVITDPEQAERRMAAWADSNREIPSSASYLGVPLPSSVVEYVRRSQEQVLLDDAATSHIFGADPYLQARRPGSVLCLPIRRSRELVGVLYLEHHTVARVFSPARLLALQTLATQAAVSLENAQLYEQLESETRRYRVLYDENPSIYFTVDSVGIIRSVNEFGAGQLGFEPAELVGRPYAELWDDEDRQAGQQFLNLALNGDGNLQRWELRKNTRTGEQIWMREAARRIDHGDGAGREALLLIVAENTTEAWRLSEELGYQATHDDLTGLSNRRDFERRLTGLLEEAGAIREESALTRGGELRAHALLYLDLDQFKVVNDTVGHIAGDELLRQLTSRLRRQFRGGDVIARIGGDEFAVLMENVSLTEAVDRAEALLAELTALGFSWEGRHFRVGASIGLVPIGADTANLHAALTAADAACYLAKESGGNRIHVYDATDVAAVQRFGQLQWVPRLNEALAENRFFLVYQTIQPLRPVPDQGAHIEILLRLREADGSVVPPSEFLPVAERYQMSSMLDEWVVSTTLDWLLAEPGRLDQVAVCSINLSGRSIGDPHFQRRLTCLLAQSPVPKDHLCFEITETAAITHMDNAMRFMEDLRSRGCRFALDDFGSGLASFFYLKMLPVDFVKIDGVFVRDILTNDFDLALVRSTSEVARAGGMRTVAEFAETPAIVERLREIGVDYAQGYAVSRPVPLEDFKPLSTS